MKAVKYTGFLAITLMLAGCGQIGEHISKEQAEGMVVSKYEKEGEKEVVILKTRETRASYWITWEYKQTHQGGTSKVSQNKSVETIETYTD